MIRLAVDALNLVADHRGMGRYVRRILHDWETATALEVVLIVRDPAHQPILAGEFPYEVQSLYQARHQPSDVTWYPWNGIRFEFSRRKIVTIHDAFAFTYAHRNFVARWREQAPIRRAARIADAFTTISQWSAHALEHALHVPASRFTVIPPVPDPFWTPVGPGESADRYVLFVAGPDERKNARTLFAAFARAFQRGGVRLVCAGPLNPGDEARLKREAFAFEHIQPTDSQLRELYGRALCVAIPSYAEGFGIMAVEAMACGAPVIAADAGALPESCYGAALLVPPLDVDAWSKALQRVASDSMLRAELATRSLKRASHIDRGAPARLMLELVRQSRAAAQ